MAVLKMLTGFAALACRSLAEAGRHLDLQLCFGCVPTFLDGSTITTCGSQDAERPRLLGPGPSYSIANPSAILCPTGLTPPKSGPLSSLLAAASAGQDAGRAVVTAHLAGDQLAVAYRTSIFLH